MNVYRYIIPFMSDQIDIKAKNQEKVDEAIRQYHEVATLLPRKAKKALRRKAEKDYKFWKLLQRWHDDACTNIGLTL